MCTVIAVSQTLGLQTNVLAGRMMKFITSSTCVHFLTHICNFWLSKMFFFYVTTDHISSSTANCTCGVPKGLTLGSFLCAVNWVKLYTPAYHFTGTSPLCTTAQLYSLKPHYSLTQWEGERGRQPVTKSLSIPEWSEWKHDVRQEGVTQDNKNWIPTLLSIYQNLIS